MHLHDRIKYWAEHYHQEHVRLEQLRIDAPPPEALFYSGCSTALREVAEELEILFVKPPRAARPALERLLATLEALAVQSTVIGKDQEEPSLYRRYHQGKAAKYRGIIQHLSPLLRGGRAWST